MVAARGPRWMTAGPRKIGRDLPNIGAFSVHDEDLLASTVSELVERNTLSVGRPCRGGAILSVVGQADIFRSVRVRYVYRPMTTRLLNGECDLRFVWGPGRRPPVLYQKAELPLTAGRQ